MVTKRRTRNVVVLSVGVGVGTSTGVGIDSFDVLAVVMRSGPHVQFVHPVRQQRKKVRMIMIARMTVCTHSSTSFQGAPPNQSVPTAKKRYSLNF